MLAAREGKEMIDADRYSSRLAGPRGECRISIVPQELLPRPRLSTGLPKEPRKPVRSLCNPAARLSLPSCQYYCELRTLCRRLKALSTRAAVGFTDSLLCPASPLPLVRGKPCHLLRCESMFVVGLSQLQQADAWFT